MVLFCIRDVLQRCEPVKVRHLFLHFLHTLMHLRARVCVLSQSMITLQSVMLSGWDRFMSSWDLRSAWYLAAWTMTSAGRLTAVILHISQTMSLDLITCVTIWLFTRNSLFREVSTMLSSMRSIQCLSMRHVHLLSFQDRVASRQDFTRHAISWLHR